MIGNWKENDFRFCEFIYLENWKLIMCSLGSYTTFALSYTANGLEVYFSHRVSQSLPVVTWQAGYSQSFTEKNCPVALCG